MRQILYQTKEAKFLQNTINIEELNKQKSGPVDIITTNEQNLEALKTKFVSPVGLGNTTGQIKTFKQLDDISKELDNTLSNLINLDGEQ